MVSKSRRKLLQLRSFQEDKKESKLKHPELWCSTCEKNGHEEKDCWQEAASAEAPGWFKRLIKSKLKKKAKSKKSRNLVPVFSTQKIVDCVHTISGLTLRRVVHFFGLNVKKYASLVSIRSDE